MKRLHPLLLSVLSGFLLWAAWPVSTFTFLIFIAFIPLLWLEQQSISRARFFYATYLAMLIWNAATTWWICNSTLPGGIAAIVVNSLLMCLPWLLFRSVKRKLGEGLGYLALISFWLSFEYMHLNWQLSWPWLTLGNVFAKQPSWVQWYEYTGSSGGSVWVLTVNILLFLVLKKRAEKRPVKRTLILSTILLFIPVLISLLIESNIEQTPGNDKNVVVVQPNIDPYEKFSAATQQAQLQQLIQLSASKIDDNTRLVVWPETALSGTQGFEENRLKEYSSLLPLWAFLQAHPNVTLYTGIETYRFYTEENKPSTAHRIPDSDKYYNAFNSATLLNTQPSDIFYHKSKLVPMVETMPPMLRFLADWFEQFGGTTGGYTPQDERTVLNNSKSGYKIAPAICYESIYGEFLTSYLRNGANVIGIITNDGWWANTAGYRQHMQYARLRAIETRRWVIRSANTGISCFIDTKGTILDAQPWDTASAIKREVPAETDLTFFAKYGDIISRIFLVTAGILLIWSIALLLRKKSHGKNDPL